LEVDDEDVLEGNGSGAVSGTFTMPDLGDEVRTVAVEAEIRAADKRKKVKRKLEYLGSAVPITALAPAVPAVTYAAPSPESISSPHAIEGASPPGARRRSSPRPRESRKRGSIEPRRHVAPGGKRRADRGRRNRDAVPGKTRPKRRAPRTAAQFDGVPEPGAGGRRGDGRGILSVNAIGTRRAVLAAARARPRDTGGLDAAVLVPALLGLAGLTLAATTMLRKRQLASGPGRD
jgi:hypothetical protein